MTQMDWEKARRRRRRTGNPPRLGAMTDRRRRFLEWQLERIKREAEQRRKT